MYFFLGMIEERWYKNYKRDVILGIGGWGVFFWGFVVLWYWGTRYVDAILFFRVYCY